MKLLRRRTMRACDSKVSGFSAFFSRCRTGFGTIAPPLGAWLILAVAIAGVGLPAAAARLSHAAGIEPMRDYMRRIDQLMFERTLPQLEVDRERLRAAGEIAEIAGQLATAAVALAERPDSALTDPAEREQFIANARLLAVEAGRLEQLVQDGRYRELRAGLERFSRACANCHVDFRSGGR